MCGRCNQANFANQASQVNNPIVTRQTNVVNRYFYIDQPHICEMETQYVNHYIKRHTYVPRYITNEQNVYSEVNCGYVQNAINGTNVNNGCYNGCNNGCGTNTQNSGCTNNNCGC